MTRCWGRALLGHNLALPQHGLRLRLGHREGAQHAVEVEDARRPLALLLGELVDLPYGGLCHDKVYI